MCSRIYYRTLSYFVCNFTSLKAKNCWSGFETDRPRDSCYDFVMYIYNQSLSKRTFLRLVVVITPLHPSIRSYEVIVSIVAFQILFLWFYDVFCALKVENSLDISAWASNPSMARILLLCPFLFHPNTFASF